MTVKHVRNRGIFFCFDESLEQTLRDPAVACIDIATDDHAMHRREDFCFFPVGDFFILIVLEQAGYQRMPLEERRGSARGNDRVELTGDQHVVERLIGGDRRQPNLWWQLELELFDTSGLVETTIEPFDVLWADAVFVLQNATNPKRRRHLIFGYADLLSTQVVGRADPGARIDVNAGVPEHAR